MSSITIGIQLIMPKTGTSPHQVSPPQPDSEQPESRRDSDHADMIAEAVARQAPPPPGMGKLVDKTV